MLWQLLPRTGFSTQLDAHLMEPKKVIQTVIPGQKASTYSGLSGSVHPLRHPWKPSCNCPERTCQRWAYLQAYREGLLGRRICSGEPHQSTCYSLWDEGLWQVRVHCHVAGRSCKPVGRLCRIHQIPALPSFATTRRAWKVIKNGFVWDKAGPQARSSILEGGIAIVRKTGYIKSKT